jgi:lipopolysaccharide transport system permease protein
MKTPAIDTDDSDGRLPGSGSAPQPPSQAVKEETRILQESGSVVLPRPRDTRPVKVIRPPAFSLATVASGIINLTRYSDLLYTLTLFRLTVRYKQSVLGWIWAALQPLTLMIIYTLIFSRMARITSEGMPYPLFVFVALLPWIFFSTAITNAVNGLANSPALLTKMYFPREIIPLSYVAAAFVDFGIAFILLTGLMRYYHVSLSWTALYAVPLLALLCAFTTAVALFLSCLQVRFRDVAVALPFFLQVGVFATPIAYPIQSVPSRFQRVYLLNPVASLIENFRRAVLHGIAPDIRMLVTSAALTLLSLALAYSYFKARESTMADIL